MAFLYNRVFSLAFDRCLDLLGEEAVHFKKSEKFQSGSHLRGLFSNSALITEVGNGAAVSNLMISFEVLGTEAHVSIGDRMLVRGDLYRVSDVQKNDTGNPKLILQDAKKVKREQT